MNSVLLVYGDAGKGEFTECPSSFPELKKRLEQLKIEYKRLLGIPYSVDLVCEGIGRLSVGLGDDKWMLFYSSEEGDTLNSLGDENTEGTVMFHFGDHTELSKKYLVPVSDALEVIRIWFEKAELSNVIKWTEKD